MSSPPTHPRAAYRGRFAPSPTGPLHFGSLVTALGSFLQARRHGGTWLLRIDDLDPPREMPGAADAILRTLEAHHLYWDEAVRYQSRRAAAYQAAIDALDRQQQLFPCGCSRKARHDTQASGADGVYPGTCRNGLPAGATARALRLRVMPETVTFEDRICGPQHGELPRSVGDFVVRRADGLYAYHLAAAVDDAEQQITEVIRGGDLLTSTFPQYYLQALLALPHPAYGHLPIAVNAQGEKLSKQTRAEPLDDRRPGAALAAALAFLGHDPDPAVDRRNPAELLAWASSHWDLARIPAARAIRYEPSVISHP